MLCHPAGLISLALALLTGIGALAQDARALRFTIDAEWFGGFSAIAVDPGGDTALIVSDRGRFLPIAFDRGPDGIRAIRADPPIRVRNNDGHALRGRAADAEGIALRQGEVCISFEGVPRVACFDQPGAKARPLPRPQAFREMPLNRALEALAVDPQGHLVTLPEEVPEDGRIPLFRWTGATWTSAGTIPASGRFLPVGADFGPQGRLYVLERNLGAGFRSQIRRFDYAGGQVIGPGQTVWASARGAHDNLEGLSIWSDAAGQVWATMIADDNFKFFQTTEIVEVPLPPLAIAAQSH